MTRVYAAWSPLWVLMGAIAFLQPLNGVRPWTPSASVGDLALVGLSLACLPFLSRLRMPPRLLVPFVGVLTMAAGGLLGMVATDGWWQLEWLARFVLGMPFVIVTLSVVRPSPRLATWLAGCYCAGAAVSAVAAVFGPVVPGFARAHGLGEHLMHLAVSTMFGVVFAIGWFVSATTWKVRVLAVALGLLCLWGQLLTGARSALIGTLIAATYLAILGRRRGLYAAAGATVAGAVALAAAMPFMPPGSTLHRIFGGELTGLVDLSNSAHIQDARDALAEIGQHPLTGLGFAQGLDAHNLVLEAANMGGVLGLAGFFLIWSTVGCLLVRQLRLGIRPQHWVRAAPLVGVMGYFALAQLENMVWDRHLWFYITVALFALPPTLADPDDEAQDPWDDQKVGNTLDRAAAPTPSSACTTATSQ
ncbi:O-antigen ligase family protein [Nocardioides piscis]|uniref:O-antigen ligase family protein n=1 Tax=Nocardioides piscis TaxID=2714938 RepID=A0A6G7YEZ2_9ACTN|nr:hypothetical protein [Nocardioides piscis]QIK75211.1 hypothetical protein G7071_07010 [Nocardioides piscis]